MATADMEHWTDSICHTRKSLLGGEMWDKVCCAAVCCQLGRRSICVNRKGSSELADTSSISNNDGGRLAGGSPLAGWMAGRSRGLVGDEQVE